MPAPGATIQSSLSGDLIAGLVLPLGRDSDLDSAQLSLEIRMMVDEDARR